MPQPIQKPSTKALIIKFVINVVSFALLYTLFTLLVMALGITGDIAPAIPPLLAILCLTGAMRIIGPWIDKRYPG